MEAHGLPLILEPGALPDRPDRDGTIVVHVGDAARYRAGHLPGARHLDYAALTVANAPVQGLLPPVEALGTALAAAGITPGAHVTAYDDEGGAMACRLLWTLDVLGNGRFSLLDGGLAAWRSLRRPVEQAPPATAPGHYPATYGPDRRADRVYLLQRLQDPDMRLLDARSPDEFAGRDVRARRGGHIPGAVNVEWLRAVDREHHSRLRPAAELRRLYEAAEITPDREIVTYCHSHRRSAHTYIVLKALGYPRLRGYPGSWSDWGNAFDTPVE